jgi:hypothetical protein
MVGGWTGLVTIGVIVYIAIAIYVTLAATDPGPALATYLIFSDLPASLTAILLAFLAARSAAELATRRTWTLLAAALVTYVTANLIDAIYRVMGVEPFPSVADFVYLIFYLLLLAAFVIAIRASALRMPWGRLLLDSLILVLGFGTFFWYFVISPAAAVNQEDLARFVLSQAYIALDCLMLMAIGVLLMNSVRGPLRRSTLLLLSAGFAVMFLADIVWATSAVTDEYLPGNFSDVLYLSCYVGLIAAAQ